MDKTRNNPCGLAAVPEAAAANAVALGNEKVFDVLLNALKETYRELYELGFKISGAEVIALGWFATD